MERLGEPSTGSIDGEWQLYLDGKLLSDRIDKGQAEKAASQMMFARDAQELLETMLARFYCGGAPNGPSRVTMCDVSALLDKYTPASELDKAWQRFAGEHEPEVICSKDTFEIIWDFARAAK